MKSLRALVVAVVLASVGAIAGTSLAAPRVVVVLPSEMESDSALFETRLRSELQSAGFEVMTIRVPLPPGPQGLEDIAVDSDSVAAVSVQRPAGSVSANMWVTERITGKTVYRSVRPEKASPDAPSLLALRAVELLRASLLELNEAHPQRGAVSAPSVVRAWIAPSVPSATSSRVIASEPWDVGAGASLIGAPGGIAAGAAASLKIGYEVAKNWRAELRWQGPFLTTVQSDIGSARVDQELITTRLRWQPVAGSHAASLFLSLGFGVHRFAASGAASDPYAGRTAAVYSPLALVGIGIRIKLGKSLALVPELSMLLAASRPTLVFSDLHAYHTGRPFIDGSLMLEHTW